MTLTRHFAYWPKGVPTSITVPKTTLYDNLLVSARRYPDKTAIYYYGTAVTYDRLLAEAKALAGYLQHELGVKRGDRVLLYMQNAPQFFVSFFGILAAGAVVVPMNPMNMTEELRFYIEDGGIETALVGQELLPRITPLQKETTLQHIVAAAYSDYIEGTPKYALPDVVTAPRQTDVGDDVVLWADALNRGLQPVDVGTTCDDLAVLPYTSGTTGRPKGCMHTHRTVQANVAGGANARMTTPESVTLTVLPLFHVTGLVHCMNVPVYLGATSVLMTRWDRETAAQLIEDQRVTSWTNISTMMIDFLANPNLSKYDLSSLASIGGGGATLPAAVGERLKQLFGLNYTEGYGLSETIAQVTFNPPDRPKLQCMGMPCPDVDARVVNPQTLEELGPNEEGELIVNGPQVFLGYWNRPEENAKAFVELDGKRFFRTGDLVRYDEEGYLFMVDRLKRMINASGFKVWPAEVESLLYQHEAVQMACVIGAPDEHRGETVKAYIVLKADYQGRVRPEDIIEWTKDKIAAYKRPRLVEFVDALPMSGTGKVMWRTLQEKEWAQVKA
ncbi:long-chain fatty acid--CoA ligase [Alicyclobacillus cycloheptanicus]|uniref:Fatty-acyl-CoA synthase n=1 Tax=Alicyclobacillus cycloheptanicus TaxID=1457 RepID=A0ABT9XIZ7_9BACL|nr:long-chain fatty acid--CoA ligase [Alicyclobacillus cycloheptanicus]MDQ0190286.1 fatty-acyl-CoA synthase [Alicyclobacillus cycloheptanicus]